MELTKDHLREQIKVFRHHFQAQGRRLSVEGVHQLRVSTRRLHATLDLLEENGIRLSPQMTASLKLLRQSLGERRQWDVARKGARKYHLKEKNLIKDQEAAGVLLQDALKNPGVKALPEELAVLNKQLKHKNIEIQKSSLKRIRKNLKAWLASKKLSPKELHKLRIETKKIRYAFESLGLPTDKLEVLQDHLGKSHDLMVLSEYFDAPKDVKKDEKRERKKAKKQIRPALRSSLEVLKSLR